MEGLALACRLLSSSSLRACGTALFFSEAILLFFSTFTTRSLVQRRRQMAAPRCPRPQHQSCWRVRPRTLAAGERFLARTTRYFGHGY